jgi:glucokinase
LRIFARVYGAVAGNLALRLLPYGGLYIAGGIAPKVLPFLTDAAFLEAFVNKGKLARLMPEFPVHVVLDPRAPLFGAALAGAWH